MMDSVDSLLTMQNAGGGFASYELIRGPAWLEWLNHAEVFGEFSISLVSFRKEGREKRGLTISLLLSLSRRFVSGNIMIEYNYPECTTSVLSALKVFSKKFPDYRSKEIE